jgi:dihydrodipicolinate synthase/N-acetylneuraminate lyase
MKIKDLPQTLVEQFHNGMVIPAHPLALNQNRELDIRHQNALTRYYIDAGAGGIAVGVHTTQFEIRKAGIDLFKPVLSMASETVDSYCKINNKPAILKIAGICGHKKQAVAEAEFAIDTGYHAGLLSLAAFADADINSIITHCRAVAQIIPIIGFYLQPAVGGRKLPYEFWVRFAEIENCLGIKMAPFNRYQTLDVIRAVCNAGREMDIALYTGNDDNILIDLLTEYEISTPVGVKKIRIVGGLLGHWAVWTRKAVELLDNIHRLTAEKFDINPQLLTMAAQITDCNAAFFDTANNFAGCIPGIHEVLRRQGLLDGVWCLDLNEELSAGQKEEIDRVCRDYPHLNDDYFVKNNLQKWLSY